MRLEAPYYSTTALLFFGGHLYRRVRKNYVRICELAHLFGVYSYFLYQGQVRKKEQKRGGRPMINFFANSKPFSSD